jgi:hypothetical protein
VICRESGEYLLDLILDSKINPVLLSSFVGALSLFGKDNLGKIEEINEKGLDVDMIIVYKYRLIFIAIISHEMKPDIRDEAEKALDMFYSSYVEELDHLESLDVSIFEGFKKVLYLQIQDYFEILEAKEKDQKMGDFGFFTEAIRKLRNGTSSNGFH